MGSIRFRRVAESVDTKCVPSPRRDMITEPIIIFINPEIRQELSALEDNFACIGCAYCRSCIDGRTPRHATYSPPARKYAMNTLAMKPIFFFAKHVAA